MGVWLTVPKKQNEEIWPEDRAGGAMLNQILNQSLSLNLNLSAAT